MSEELKACPFCGSISVREGCDTPDAKWHYVECDDCHATSKADLGVSGAIENWQSRPIEDSLRKEIESLQSMTIVYHTKQVDALRAELELSRKIADEAIKQNEILTKQLQKEQDRNKLFIEVITAIASIIFTPRYAYRFTSTKRTRFQFFTHSFLQSY